MKRKNITKSSQQAIDAGILDISFGRYEPAEQRFEGLVEDLKDRGDRFKPYLWTAAFGMGLAEGMKHRQTDKRPRSIPEVAAMANNLYEAFLTFSQLPSDQEKYRMLGKSYATLGLESEGLEILDLSRRSDILSFYKLCPDAKKLAVDR